MRNVQRIAEVGADSGLGERNPAALQKSGALILTDKEIAVVEEMNLPLPSMRQIGVNNVEVLERLDRLE